MAARLHAPEAQSVTFVELFFDLVFVFAVTQVTVLTVHHLDAGGVARSAVLFWLIWWAWTQFTWTLSPADTQHTAVRALTLAATATAFVMAASVPRAFEDDPLWFAVPYVVVRLLGLALQVRVDREQHEHAHADHDGHHDDEGISMTWVWISLVGLGVVLLGGVVDVPGRTWVWVGAVAIDFAAASVAGNGAVWHLHTGHFSERHGLFVIIALGESLIVAGTAVAGDDRTADLVLTAGASLVVACLLWWTYFGWLKEALEERFAEATPEQVGALARDAYSLTHFPLIGGIIGFAVAVEEIVIHPDQPAEAAVVASLVVGVGLFITASAAAHLRLSGEVLWPRLAITAGALGLAVAVSGGHPVWPLVVVAAGLLAVVIVEERTLRRETAADLAVD
jgi:low temperature requirement protein LtrA